MLPTQSGYCYPKCKIMKSSQIGCLCLCPWRNCPRSGKIIRIPGLMLFAYESNTKGIKVIVLTRYNTMVLYQRIISIMWCFILSVSNFLASGEHQWIAPFQCRKLKITYDTRILCCNWLFACVSLKEVRTYKYIHRYEIKTSHFINFKLTYICITCGDRVISG